MDALVRMPNGLWARRDTSDKGTWHDVFDKDKRWHRPPSDLAMDLKIIVDLGAYVGYTAYDYLSLFPHSEVLAIEPDQENFDLMNRNLFDDYRVYATYGAISNYTGTGSLTGDAFNAKKLIAGDAIDVYTLDDFIGREHKTIDFIKFDVEGEEKNILKHGGEWPYKTKCVKVEVHNDYSIEECSEDLQRLGFMTQLDESHGQCVIGMK